jgi:hypothetical protein
MEAPDPARKQGRDTGGRDQTGKKHFKKEKEKKKTI